MIVSSRLRAWARRLDPGARRVARGLWVWGPVVVWLGVIALTSGEAGAHAHSDVWVWRVVHEWLPSLFGMEPPAAAPAFLPWWVRKSAHVAEYAVLGALAARALHQSVAAAGAVTRAPHGLRSSHRLRFWRAPRGPGAPRKGRLPVVRGLLSGVRRLPAAVVMGVPLCGAVAIIDELHQSALASRTGSPRDVAYDVVGAALGLVIGWLVWRREDLTG